MELTVQKREILGKKVKSLRNQNFIPAELYGHDLKNIHLSIPAKDFSRLFRETGESTVINLVLGKEKLPVLIHDVQKNLLTEDISHIDFYQVRMDEKITAAVPLEFIGEAPAIKEKGGVLIKAVHELEVEALPGDLPRNIPVDLSLLSDIGADIYIRDLKIGGKVKILAHPETVIATVAEEKEEVEEKPVSVEEVKVKSEEKKEGKEEKEEEKSETS